MHENWLLSRTRVRDVAATICSRCCLALAWKPTKFVKPTIVLLVCLFSLYSFFSIFNCPAVFTPLLHSQSPPQSEVENHKSSEELVYGDDDDDDDDKQSGGILPTQGTKKDENSCMSRYQSKLYRPKSLPPNQLRPQPSTYLKSRLKLYEKLHKRCGPNTFSYNSTLQDLTDFVMSTGPDRDFQEKTYDSIGGDCKYVIWSPIEGLGNRMLTLAATFLYALLSNRVVLIAEPGNLPDLFCEPFPQVSWLLPSDFPIRQFSSFNYFSPHRYGNRNITPADPPMVEPLMSYIHLVHDYDDSDKMFFCDEHQTFLQNVPWLILKSDLYFVPSLYSVTYFQQELARLFPEKETVFHHLGRYLFHPTNSVWGLITRYYETYLAKADQMLGIQVRVFEHDDGPINLIVLQRILECTITQEKLLPDVILAETFPKPFVNYSIGTTRKHLQTRSKHHHHVAVMITSLKPGYYEEIKDIYWYHETVTGESIEVFQPSHEEYQKSGDEMHDRIALAEMYLLSMSDKLVTSGQSTFGYVAQSLGGLRPWILKKDHDNEDGKQRPNDNKPCKRALSMEPCFHYAPVNNYCGGVPADIAVPYVRQCEDVVKGLKLFDY